MSQLFFFICRVFAWAETAIMAQLPAAEVVGVPFSLAGPYSPQGTIHGTGFRHPAGMTRAAFPQL